MTCAVACREWYVLLWHGYTLRVSLSPAALCRIWYAFDVKESRDLVWSDVEMQVSFASALTTKHGEKDGA